MRAAQQARGNDAQVKYWIITLETRQAFPGWEQPVVARTSGDTTPCVKSLRSSYTGLCPQRTPCSGRVAILALMQAAAKRRRQKLERLRGLLPQNQGQNLALTVLYVP